MMTACVLAESGPQNLLNTSIDPATVAFRSVNDIVCADAGATIVAAMTAAISLAFQFFISIPHRIDCARYLLTFEHGEASINAVARSDLVHRPSVRTVVRGDGPW